MSHNLMEQTKLGTRYDMYGVKMETNAPYPNDQEMEDIASSPVQLVGEVVPESDVPSLGLTPTDPLTAENLREVTGLRMTVARNPGDAESVSTENIITGANVAEPIASGSWMFGDAQHHMETAATLGQARAKSPVSRVRHELRPRTCTADLRAWMARVRQTRMTRYLQAPPLPPPSAIVPHDTVTRAEADMALGELQRQIGDATQRTNTLVQAVNETHQKAQAAGQIAVLGAVGVAQTNAGLNQMLQELRQELQQMRMKIQGAEQRADAAQRVADVAEQRADAARHADDAAEQRAVAVQSNADVAQAKQERLEQELRNADVAFQEERKIRTKEIAAAQLTIGTLRCELHDASTRLDQQGVIVQNVARIGGELREARKDMALQAAEMRQMGDMTDEMLGHVEELTTAFHHIDAKQQRGNIVNPDVVESTPVHVQGTISDVKEPAGHVQTEPSSVINLVSGEYEEEERQPMTGRDYIKNLVDEQYRKIKEEIRSGKQPCWCNSPEVYSS